MNGPFHVPAGYYWEDPHELQGCGDAAVFRLTRRYDGASVILHAIRPDEAERIGRQACCDHVPTFRESFITPLLGTVRLSGQHYLLEAVPSCVPLIAAWQTVVQEASTLSSRMLVEAIGQLDRLLRRLSVRGETHGALCAANVVLTTGGTYGLLAARVNVAEGVIWVRRPSRQVDNIWTDPAGSTDSIVPILRELLDPDVCGRDELRSVESEFDSLHLFR